MPTLIMCALRGANIGHAHDARKLLPEARGWPTPASMIPEPLRRLSERAIVRQAMRFAAAGAVATIVHFAVLIALVEWGGLDPVFASTLAYCVGVVVSFTLNRRFTFDARGPVAPTFAKYAAIYAVGIFLNGAIMAALISIGLWYILAQIIAVALILSWNFLGARYIVFR